MNLHVQGLRDRWQSPEGRQLQVMIVDTVRSGAGIERIVPKSFPGATEIEGLVDLRGVNLQHLKGVHACLHYVCLDHAILDGCDLTGADLQFSTLKYASLGGACLRSSAFIGVDASDAILDSADCESAMMNSAVFSRASFRRANLRRCDLSWSKLNACCLVESVIACADLYLADLRGQTCRWLIWPELICSMQSLKGQYWIQQDFLTARSLCHSDTWSCSRDLR